MSEDPQWLDEIDWDDWSDDHIDVHSVLDGFIEDMWGKIIMQLNADEIEGDKELELRRFTSKIAQNFRFGVIDYPGDQFPDALNFFNDILHRETRYQDINSILDDPTISNDAKTHLKNFTNYFTPSEGHNKHREIRHNAIWGLYLTGLWELTDNIKISMNGSQDDIGDNDDMAFA